MTTIDSEQLITYMCRLLPVAKLKTGAPWSQPFLRIRISFSKQALRRLRNGVELPQLPDSLSILSW